MKQKQVKAAPKNAKQTNLKKATPPKKVAVPVEDEEDEEEEVVAVKKPANKRAATVQKKVSPSKKVAAPVEEEEEDDDEEEVVEKKVVAVKTQANKKAAPVQKKVIEVVEEPEEEEDDEVEDDEVEEEEDVDADDDQEEQDEEVEAMEEDGEEQDEDAEEEDDDDEEQEENDEDAEEEQEENDEDDDEGPTEAPIDEEPTIPSKVKTGQIPAKVPLNRIVHITKLPRKCKQIDIVEAFAKFGAIDQIHLDTTPNGIVANVAFKTEKAAEAATALSRKIKVKDSPVEVTAKKPRKEKKEDATGKFDVEECRDRTVYVKYLKLSTTDIQVREHFAECGEIQRLRVISKNRATFAYITFAKKECVKIALKLHNSVLNGGTIGVYETIPEKVIQLGQRDPKLIVKLKNKQQLQVLEGAILEKIFSKCGQIDHMEVLCGKNVLAFIIFKNEQAVEKALKMTGKTEEGIVLDVEKYDGHKKKTGIHVSNIPPDCTEEDLKQHFSESGEILSVILRKGYAVIHFKNTDGYCKSFLLDESYIKKQMIFVEPLSTRKQILLKTRISKLLEAKKGIRKRPFQNGTTVFKGKKPKLE